ncbi:MAG: TetR/AcrR family transcriptional regulator [Micrococcales bacterium]|nr:TetR/AcrR family transcriptional regulator [Micrococcales bacterium]MCL2667113.1 TetR/AcrR family transcriptional regulator [Micrococcales bacterium]
MTPNRPMPGPDPGPDPVSGATTRERLLEATVASLRVHGTAGLTSREITRAAGANLQAITYHFGSKDALVAEALTGMLRERLVPVRADLDSGDDPVERLLAALGTIIGSFSAARADLAAYADAMAAAAANPPLAAALTDLHTELVDYIATLIVDLQREGYIQRWVDPPAMAALLVAIGDGLAMHARYGEPDVDGVLDQAAQLLLAAREPSKRLAPAATRLLLRRLHSSARG